MSWNVHINNSNAEKGQERFELPEKQTVAPKLLAVNTEGKG